MSMMAFSRAPRRSPDPGEVRREIMFRRSESGVRDALYSVVQGRDPSEAAEAMHTALSEAGYETSRESVEAALRELAAALRTPAPEPEPPEPLEGPEASETSEPEDVGADVVMLDDRRPEPEPLEDETPDTPLPLEDPGSDPSEVLYYLVDYYVRLEVRGGNLYAGRPAGLTPRLREILRVHKEALITLLDDEAVAAALPEATEYVSEALRARGEGRGSGDGQRASKYLTMAGNAYSRREYALARYRLRRAQMAAAGRREDDAPPDPRPAASDSTPESRAKSVGPSEPTEVRARVDSKGDDLEPGHDHQVLFDRNPKVILLASLYPSKIALEGAKMAYQRANPGRRVEVRRSRRVE